MIELLFLLCGSIGSIAATYFLMTRNKKEDIAKPVTVPAPIINLDGVSSEIRSSRKELVKEIESVPEEVLKAITGLNNTHKGKLGELIGYIQLKAEYDKIIPLGTIVDFVGIKFPKDNQSGEIVFIDIKTGKNAKLNADQRSLKKTIENGKVSFVKINIDQIDLMEEKDDSASTDQAS